MAGDAWASTFVTEDPTTFDQREREASRHRIGTSSTGFAVEATRTHPATRKADNRRRNKAARRARRVNR